VKRRELITLLGGAAVAWPLSARAQQRMPRVGVLVGLASSADDSVAVESLRPFNQEMQKAGWIEGNTSAWTTVLAAVIS
jgi:putative ABC transport system substrate-binding protein